MGITKSIFTHNQKLIAVLLSLAMIVSGVVALNSITEAKERDTKPGPCIQKMKETATIKQSGNKLTATYNVPKSCNNKKEVSFVVYKLNNGNWKDKVNNQYIYQSQTQKVKEGAKKSITLALPNCAWQADLVFGKPVDISKEGAKQNPIIVAKVGGNRVPCKKAPVVPTPDKPATPTTPTTPEEEAGTVDNVKVSDEAAGVTPTSLPETGPGAVVATFAGVSSLSTLAYRIFTRRFGVDQ